MELRTFLNSKYKKMNTETETKTCTKCEKELDLTEFYKAKRNKDGLFNVCKKCHQKRNRPHLNNPYKFF